MELSALDFIKTLGVSFAALFPIVNPFGDAPIFFGLTRNYPQSAQKVLARKIAAYGFVLLVVSALFGSEILAFFGISLFVVQIAGGLVVAATGWKLLNQPDDDSSSKQVPGTLEDALQHAFFPFRTPVRRSGRARSPSQSRSVPTCAIKPARDLNTGIRATLSPRQRACFSSACWLWSATATRPDWWVCSANPAPAF